MIAAVIVSFIGFSPIQLLFVCSIVGGLGTPISLAFLLLIARHHSLMDDHRIGKVLMAGGWMIVVVVSAVSVYFLWQQFGSAL